MESKTKQNKKLIAAENRLVVARGMELRVGEMDEWGQKAHTFSYKINHEDVMYNMVTIVNNTISYV